MIRILVVDDSPEKTADIKQVIDQLFLQDTIDLREAGDVGTASAMVQKENFDLLILDLNLPMRTGEEPRADNGVHFLRLIDHNSGGTFRVPNHILGLTEFHELATKYAQAFKNWHLIQYQRNTSDWQHRLSDKILHIVASRTSHEGKFECDLAIITALEEVELAAILKLPATWAAFTPPGDCSIYHRGTFSRDSKDIQVVAVAALEMGMPAAAALSMKVISQFRPKYLAMAGITAGVRGVGALGDILVADSAFDFGSGKRKRDKDGTQEFSPAPYPIPLDASLRAKVSLLKSQSAVLKGIRDGWNDGNAPSELNLHIGPMASGAAVISDGEIVKEILGGNRKLIGLDMETYSIFVSSRFCLEPRPLAFSAKSICDFADEKKSDKFQSYAAYTSAQFIFELALRYL